MSDVFAHAIGALSFRKMSSDTHRLRDKEIKLGVYIANSVRTCSCMVQPRLHQMYSFSHVQHAKYRSSAPENFRKFKIQTKQGGQMYQKQIVEIPITLVKTVFAQSAFNLDEKTFRKPKLLMVQPVCIYLNRI